MIKKAGRCDIPFCCEECAEAAYTAHGWNKRGKKLDRSLYHVGPRGPAPSFGVWATRNIEFEDKTSITINVNVGGGVVVRPWTESDYKAVGKQRLQSGFSEGCTVCILPSLSKYGKGFKYPSDRK